MTQTERVTIVTKYIEYIYISKIINSDSEISYRLNFQMTSGRTLSFPIKEKEDGQLCAMRRQNDVLEAIKSGMPYLFLQDSTQGV